MNKTIQLTRDDLTQDPQDVQQMANPQVARKWLVANRTDERDEADETDVIIFEGRRHKIDEKQVHPSAVHYYLFDVGSIV